MDPLPLARSAESPERRASRQSRKRTRALRVVIPMSKQLPLMPLVICLYVLRHLGTESNDHEALSELLVCELTSERSLFLSPSGRVPRLQGPVIADPAEEDTASAGLPDNPWTRSPNRP